MHRNRNVMRDRNIGKRGILLEKQFLTEIEFIRKNLDRKGITNRKMKCYEKEPVGRKEI